MNDPDTIYQKLRDAIVASDLRLTQISTRSRIPYDRLRRFSLGKRQLELSEADALHRVLCGNSFIVNTDEP